MRSEPGKGEPIAIFVLDDEKAADGVCKAGGRYHRSVMLCSVGEDYSESMWPVVVKVKRGASAEFVASRLEDLTDAIRHGFLREVPAKLPSRRADLIGKIRVWKGAEVQSQTPAKVMADLAEAVKSARELLEELTAKKEAAAEEATPAAQPQAEPKAQEAALVEEPEAVEDEPGAEESKGRKKGGRTRKKSGADETGSSKGE
ncbi:MAG: hypothetical protein ACYTFZ_01335 [Planctomycetota bacterium]|jgi:hypothetical protein